MKSIHAKLTPGSPSSARAHFSPLMRRSTQPGFKYTEGDGQSARVPAFGQFLATDRLARVLGRAYAPAWRSSLLDRLQSPLTRFHD